MTPNRPGVAHPECRPGTWDLALRYYTSAGYAASGFMRRVSSAFVLQSVSNSPLLRQRRSLSGRLQCAGPGRLRVRTWAVLSDLPGPETQTGCHATGLFQARVRRPCARRVEINGLECASPVNRQQLDEAGRAAGSLKLRICRGHLSNWCGKPPGNGRSSRLNSARAGG